MKEEGQIEWIDEVAEVTESQLAFLKSRRRDMLNPEAEAAIAGIIAVYDVGFDGRTGLYASLYSAMIWAYRDAIQACNKCGWPPGAIKDCVEAIERRVRVEL
jgi:hypothetical protein